MKGKIGKMLKSKKIVALVLSLALVLVVGVIAIPNAMNVKASNVVPEGLLDVKMQIQKVSGSLNMRLLSTVDSLDYENVGFEVAFDSNDNGEFEEDEIISWTTTTVFKRINATANGVSYKYSPKVIDTDAEYFITGTLFGINQEKLGNDFYVRAFCTPNGSSVKTYGVGRYFNITDATDEKIINIPVAMDSLPAGVSEGTKDLAVTVAGVATTAEVLDYKDGYAQLNVNVPANASVTATKVADKTKLASANKIVVSANSASAIYRNLESTYANKNAGDNTWYTIDKTADAFVIATDADLYGWALAGTIDSNTAPKKVYIVSDITLNAGTVAEWEATSFKNLVNWNPTGSLWGTLDGQGHTISGLYSSIAGQKLGLIGGASCEAIKNLKLVNSYLTSSYAGEVYAGSIMGQGGCKMENVYSDAKIVTTKGTTAGGLVGYGAYRDLQMKACEYTGDIVVNCVDSTGGTFPYAGGLVARPTKNISMADCKFEGTLNVTYMQTGALTDQLNFFVGGLLGRAHGTVAMNNSISAGNVSILWKKNPSVDYTASGVKVPTTISCAASLIGHAATTFTSTNVYDLNTVTAQVEGKTATALTAATVGTQPSTLVYRFPKTSLLGLDGCRYLPLDFENTWAAVEGKVPQLKAFAENQMDTTGVTCIADFAWFTKGTGTDASPYVLNNAKDLYGFSFLSKVSPYNVVSTKVVKLGADITLNEGKVEEWKADNFEGLTNWVPIGSFSGTFDGNGKTISGLYMKNSATNAGLFVETAASAKLKNFSLENSYMMSEAPLHASIGSIVGNARGTMENIYSDAEVLTKMAFKAGGLVGQNGAALTMKGCWFAGDVTVNYTDSDSVNDYNPYVGGFIGQAAQALTVEDCLFTGNVTANYKRNDAKADALNFFVGGFIGRAHAALTIKDSVINGNVLAYWKKHESVDYTASGAKVPTTLNCVATTVGHTAQAASLTNVYDFTTASTQAEGKTAASVTATVVGNTSGTATRADSKYLLGTGAYMHMPLDFAKDYGWAAVDGKLPELKYFTKKAMDISKVEKADYAWYTNGDGSTGNPYVLEDMGDLYGFATKCLTDKFTGKLVKLGNNITLNEGTVAQWKTNNFANLNRWIAINNFAGTFDGNGKTISGLYLTQDTNCAGLFGQLTAAVTIQNLYLENSYLASSATPDARIGSFVGWAQGGTLTLKNVYSDAEVVASKGMSAGGLVGYGHTNAPIVMESCWFAGEVVMNDEGAFAPYAGGMIGQSATKLTMTDCLFTGNMNITYNGTLVGTQNAFVGGFAGRCNDTAVITRCLSAGDVFISWKKNPAMNNPATAPSIACVAGVFGHVAKAYTVSSAYNATITELQVWDGVPSNIAAASIGGAPSQAIGSADKTSLAGQALFATGWSAVSNDVPVPSYFQ